MAITQSFEYRYVRTPVQSLPPMQRDMKMETLRFVHPGGFVADRDTYGNVFIFGVSGKAGISGAEHIYAAGIDTRPAPAGLSGLRDRIGTCSGLTGCSPLNSTTRNMTPIFYRTARLHTGCCWKPPKAVSSTGRTGGATAFSGRRSISPVSGTFSERTTLKAGLDFSHSSYDGRQAFSPVDIVGTAGYSIERIEFGAPTRFSVDQNEFAWFVGDQWHPGERVTVDLGLRFDRDSITDSTHAAPRAGVTFAVTRDRKTLLKAGGGLFYDRVPLNIAAFPEFPARTVLTLGPKRRRAGLDGVHQYHLRDHFEIRGAPRGTSNSIVRCSRNSRSA